MRPGCFAALALALLPPGAARAQEAVQETWFVQRVTTGDAPLRVENLWSKGRKLRAETVIAGRPILTLVNGPLYSVIDPLAGVGLAVERSPRALAEDAAGARPFGDDGERLLAAGAEQVATESAGGRPCDLYRLTDGKGRREICLTRDPARLPLRGQEFDRATSRRVETRYLDWARDFPASDAFFEPDPRIRLERLGYEEYLARAAKEAVGPAPVLYRALLHGN
jgi:hypothetical protein